MEWEFIVQPGKVFLEVRAFGPLTKDYSNAMVQEGLLFMRGHQLRHCLLDYREVESFMGAFEIYDRPKEVVQLGATRELRVAMVVLPEHFDHYRFAENVYRNNGFDFKIFTAKEPAIEFLTR